MKFSSRLDAGHQVGRWLRDQGFTADVVLGLPRGGVIVAAEIARVLNRPLDVLVVRKIGHPYHREFAVGAMAEGDVVILDDESLNRNPVSRQQLDAVIAEEAQRLRQYRDQFHGNQMISLAGKEVLIADDGLATGATMEAAVLAARKQGARSVVVTVPVASLSAIDRLERVADAVKAMVADPEFQAVGQYYDEFSQTTDDEVLDLLQTAR